MKRIIALLLALLLCCVLFAGCKKEPQKADTMHTIPPSDNINQTLEWAEILCDMALLTSERETVLYGQDFETFALSEADNEIIIKVSDMATDMMTSQANPVDMILVIDGVETATINIDPKTFDGELRFGKDMDINSLYELAFSMRLTN